MQNSKPIFYKKRENAPKEHMFVDAFDRQLKELFFIDNKKFIGEKKDEVYKTKEFVEYCRKKADEHTLVYFPWNNHLVKTVAAEDYFVLKTNRNQDLITAEEQEKLARYTVGVFGMSVGSNIAFVLTQAGISKEIYVADFDELDTTNLNRILAGIHQIGLNKTIVAARRIYEDNPFANVHIMPDGVTTQNLEELLKTKKLNCIIEEIDEMGMKIKTRILASKYKVPVVMVTDNGDGAVLHIERYDLGHDKIFGQLFSYWEKMNLDNLTKEEAGKIIIGNIVGGPAKVDPKMMRSVMRVVKKELVSWSQLGSAAIFGGTIATVAIKRIALGEDNTLDVRIHANPMDGAIRGAHS